MKRIIAINALALSLVGCYGTSNCGSSPPVEFQRLTSLWLPNGAFGSSVNSSWTLSSGEGSELVEGIYAPGEVKLAIAGELARQMAAARPALQFSLFPAANACEPALPQIDASINSLDIVVATSTAVDITPGTNAEAWFDVAASLKTPGEQLPLEQWNDRVIETRSSYYYPGSYITTLLVFNDNLKFPEGAITFSVVAILEDGSLFEFETPSLQLSKM